MADHASAAVNGSPRHRATAPASPNSSKKSGFFHRHLGHHRRRSSPVQFPNGHPVSPQTSAHSHPSANAVRRSSIASSTHDSDRPTTNGSYAADGTNGSDSTKESTESPSEASRKDSKGGSIKWAA